MKFNRKFLNTNSSNKQIVFLFVFLFSILPNDIKSQTLSNQDIIGEWEEELDELSALFVSSKRYVFLENDKVEIYQNDQLLSKGKFNLYNGNIVFSDLSVLIFQSEGSFAFPLTILNRDEIEWKGIFGIKTKLQKTKKIKCLNYISPILISENSIDEINQIARNSGFPNAYYPFAGINGCGPEDQIDLVADGNFGIACDCHDICYLISNDRNFCDQQFFTDLENICKTENKNSYKECINLAKMYTSTVKNYGESSFNKAKKQQNNYEIWLELVLVVQGKYKFTDSKTNKQGICNITIREGYLIFEWELNEKTWVAKGTLYSDGQIHIIDIGYMGGEGYLKFNKQSNSITGYLNKSRHLPSESIEKLVKVN